MNELDLLMTPLADQVRTLSGTTGPKGVETMTTDIDVANSEISEQASLISQITSALEGKAGGDGGSVETSVVTLSLANGMKAQYTDSNMQWITTPLDAKMDINVAKNTLIILGWTSGDIATGSCSRIFFTPGTGIYLVTGDCSFSSNSADPGPI